MFIKQLHVSIFVCFLEIFVLSVNRRALYLFMYDLRRFMFLEV